MNLEPVNPANRCKDEKVAVRGSHKKLGDIIVILCPHAHLTLSAPVLRAVEAHRIPLDITRARKGDHHVLFHNQVFGIELFGVILDLCSSLVPVTLSGLLQFALNHLIDEPLVCQDLLEPRDFFYKIVIFIDNLFSL